MENLFRLEFNEKQQKFYHGYRNIKENTTGWCIITEYCSEDEFHIFEAYVNRVVPHHRKFAKKEKLTLEYVLKSFIELNSFLDNLLEYNLQIKK
jgi:hypothetical protein